ncbi:flavodoxin domain-containing protein [Heliorestis convoluta]|uniref:Flavodoxin domain protein n=1 Tax=Heliorestis convoluta TaxID=356322 RepID=A0A5Q2N0F0_9FIRM|nr:flavodoxin domain-containing protein [Heliorestis convoluta]QGG48774.1 flavodoxin domain protein [Heliorestis convoluta]
MNILIAYITKYGTTEACAQKLAEKLDGSVTLVNVKKDSSATAHGYDKIILGVPIYGGDIEREMKHFVHQNFPQIMGKPLGLFICGLFEGEKGLAGLKKAYPEQLLKKAVVTDLFGGSVVQSNLGFLERPIFRMITKIKTDYSNISEEKIEAFAQKMNEK